jgi:hypothetical protein
MAQIDWNQKGHDYAENWVRGESHLPEFPDATAKEQFTEGYRTGWWNRGKNDAQAGREHFKDFPNYTAMYSYHDGWEDNFC